MDNRARGIVAVLALAGGVGCGEGAGKTVEPAARLRAELDKENGGFAPASEAPAFGIGPLAAARTFRGSPEALRPVPGGKAYRVALVWGRLPNGDAPTTGPRASAFSAAWDITLSVRGGALRLLRTMSDGNSVFRTGATDLRITGTTADGHDGAIVAVAVDAATPGILTIAIDRGKLRKEIDLAALDVTGGDALGLGDGMHGVKWTGFTEQPSCARGFAIGEWVEEAPQLGTATGQVLDGAGARIGWLRATWGYSRGTNEPQFFAKAIDEGGAFGGIATGTFLRHHISGRWTLGEQRGGTVAGVFGEPTSASPPRGLWLGAWSAMCLK